MAEAGGAEDSGVPHDWTLDEWPEIRPLLADTEWDRHGPFGFFANGSGREALDLLDGLLLRGGDPDPRNALDGDSLVYERLNEFDTGLMFIEPHPKLNGGEIGMLHRLIEDFHVALPFSEGERRWLYRRGRGGADRSVYLHDLADQTDRIMEAGVMREVNGGDLIGRWRAWRREEDEFAGQHSLERAMRALSDIAHRLILEESWPEEFGHLRRE